MLDQLKKQWETLHPRSFTVSLRKNFPELYHWAKIQPIPYETDSFSDRVFMILNTNIPICENPQCNNLVSGLNRSGWQTYCSPKCKGYHNSAKSRDKAVLTCRKNLGVDNPGQDSTIRETMRKTSMIKHGVEYALQSEEYQLKKTDSMLEKYGVEHAAQSSIFQKKMSDTCLQNHGVSNPSQIHIGKEILEKLNNKEWLIVENISKSINQIAEDLGITSSTVSKYFKTYKIIPIRHNIVSSEAENEIIEYIINLRPDINIIKGDRSILSPYELDIYLPELNLAFEYNGLYWHHEDQGKDQHYHIFKTNKCREKGIKLIHIWENDYLNSKDIVLSKISHLLGNSLKIYARQCVIKEISLKDSANFLDKTHIQGLCTSSVKLGLYYMDNLVAVMTFGKARFTSGIEWELLRYSSKLNHNIIGGFSKLLSYFIRTYNPISIISYSDKCWSTGEVYIKNGFDYKATSKPSYFYTKDFITVEHRMSFQKKKLSKKLKFFDETLSEAVNMKLNGYYKIWNCGNDSWVWTNKEE